MTDLEQHYSRYIAVLNERRFADLTELVADELVTRGECTRSVMGQRLSVESDEIWQRKRLILPVLEESCGVQAGENVPAVSGEPLDDVFFGVGAGSVDPEAVGDVVLVVDAAKGSGGGVGAAGEAAQQRRESAASLGEGAERRE